VVMPNDESRSRTRWSGKENEVVGRGPWSKGDHAARNVMIIRWCHGNEDARTSKTR
jgi:hypothetical protein